MPITNKRNTSDIVLAALQNLRLPLLVLSDSGHIAFANASLKLLLKAKGHAQDDGSDEITVLQGRLLSEAGIHVDEDREEKWTGWPVQPSQ